ncbi:hypothetical protein A2733_00125 [Candidatus Nomurabacteria bacterium RIFCSPHIGHO2_01_FULL_40_20]|uniref:Thymidylate kinase n=1 Tax=Candidatus Nomurabacteria bacterium RIFCSPHIGHO2_01_FULL_40_20 TaxID=1801738 RepID=A0A1F6V3N4_9BACT|nr:MAG: hypothetical protein A2733_00125 [Candidatus Nomurabacteria bacterium RIFCSPHIGHO2_01_FULL_40_20]
MKNKKFNKSKTHYPGKLVVIDGTDGSGKATQVEMLRKRLARDGHKVRTIDFPRYYKNFFGRFIAHCLSEQYYNWTSIHPKIASIAYAADRYESKEQMEKWLEKGYIVLADRYVSSNQIHQGGKIKDDTKRVLFIEWLNEMEYKTFKLPKPNATLYLSLPTELALKLIRERNTRMKREYLKRHRDVHESDVNFLVNSRKSALWLAGREKNWVKIDCAPEGEILSREEVHKMIYEKVKKILKK